VGGGQAQWPDVPRGRSPGRQHLHEAQEQAQGQAWEVSDGWKMQGTPGSHGWAHGSPWGVDQAKA
jgi:hypothetical protein